ncbi:MAG TPA: hypothetical protein VK041_02425 [Opitutales bacterium]|nr:hypothetical protein [Opitutales bacterium]
MSIRLQKKAPQPPGYFIRSNPNDPERGPLSIENLRDLAEFQNLQPDSLIRPENVETARPLRDLPEIFKIVFPERKQFSLKPRTIADDPDADLPPVDAASLYRCEIDPADIKPTERRKPTPPPPRATNEIQQLLSEENALLKKAKGPSERVKPPFFRSHLVFSVVRWSLVALLIFTLISTWSEFADAPMWGVLISLPLLVFIGALSAGPFLDWLLDSLSERFTQMPPPEIDYTEAEEFFRAEKWKQATIAYAKILKDDPRQLRAYREGIAAAIAAGDNKKAAQFQKDASQYLSPHDRNLLEGALHRHGLLPLPEPNSRKDE